MNNASIAYYLVRCFIADMSAEKILITEQDSINSLTTPKISEVKFSGRVDINTLLARARKKERQENKVNLVFFGLFAALILVVGILLSL